MITINKKELFSFLERYCEEHNYDYDKLMKLHQSISNIAFFGKPKDVVPNGLVNDLETQPYPVLMVKPDKNSFKATETEYTNKYLR